ncbi:hypothetical protein ROJ8625_02988 [Roseivivax jejudonensis]|uniref:Zinc finger/thioredoxin putative domain-containing protein n=1 Tax=Roseivivax jejudonensis TaxID=1529041 RepID=A0A1X6ZR77_9RHOB|nr:zinc-ribbon domain-containing protein [Roseivivax jejudonensis]SLN59208.1 hypothetical protein ROJ8625_02988 [Roseivivax jejudonensis]
MRLICPNCGAQYEVPANVIPTGGRDVQCSNCGHTWFQAHPDDPVADDAPEAHAPVRDAGAAPDPDPHTEREPEPEADPEPEPETVAEHEEDAAPRRQLDPAVADVLRQEAEYEARHRAAESSSLETQTELALDAEPEDEATRRSRQARERMARMRGETHEDPTDRARRAAASTGAVGAGAALREPDETPLPVSPESERESASRRDLLPDVDEINQTLRSADERRPVETPQGRAPEPEPQRGGFGRGFAVVILIGAALIALYVMAPRIAAALPAAADPLAGYVAAVDGARLWLDAQVAAFLDILDGPNLDPAPAEPATGDG